MANPKNRNKVIREQAIWLGCTADIVQEIREACHLIAPQTVESSEYPLLWNLMFVPAVKVVEINSQWQYKMAKRQEKFIETKFTYSVNG